MPLACLVRVPGQAKAKHTTFPLAQSAGPFGDAGRGMIRNLGPPRARARLRRLRRRRGGGEAAQLHLRKVGGKVSMETAAPSISRDLGKNWL